MNEQRVQKVCIAWYRRGQWFLLKQSAVDSDIIEDTYEEWEEEAEKAVQKLIASGLQPYKVDVDVFELEKWCTEKGLPNDSKARSRFAAERAMQNEERL
jgi:hypothetical protein